MPSVPPAFWIIAAVMLGAIFGSFVNMAAYRLPRGISTWKRQRSFCPKCDHQLGWADNIPIVSYLFLGGKCRYCKAPIPARYLYAELLISALFALCAYQYFVLNGGIGGPMPAAWFAVELFLIVDLVLLSIVDLEVWLIPIETTLWWVPAGVILSVIFPDSLHPAKTAWTLTTWLNGLIDSFSGMAIGAGFLWAMNPIVAALVMLKYKLRGIDEAPPEAMGLGDVHMMGMFGAMLGWKAALMAILFGVVLGATVGLTKITWNAIQRWRMGDKFAPPPQPTFDLPEDDKPPDPQLWRLPIYGVVVLIAVMLLSSRMNFTPQTIDFLAPYYLMALIGIMLIVGFLFYLYLQKINRLPGGVISDKESGKVEVYQGNYIPFGPSLAAGCLIVALWEPLLRAFGGWFFAGTTTPPPTTWGYRVVGDATLAAGLTWFFIKFNAVTRWLMSLFGWNPQ